VVSLDRVVVVPSHTVIWTTAPHTRTGIASIMGEATCRSCWGMITILSGSTPRRHSEVGSIFGQHRHGGLLLIHSFNATSGHRRRSASKTSR
jgi:hypothetical protein